MEQHTIFYVTLFGEGKTLNGMIKANSFEEALEYLKTNYGEWGVVSLEKAMRVML